MEEKLGNLTEAIHYRELEKKASPFPEVVQEQINDLQKKMAAKKASP